VRESEKATFFLFFVGRRFALYIHYVCPCVYLRESEIQLLMKVIENQRERGKKVGHLSSTTLIPLQHNSREIIKRVVI